MHDMMSIKPKKDTQINWNMIFLWTDIKQCCALFCRFHTLQLWNLALFIYLITTMLILIFLFLSLPLLSSGSITYTEFLNGYVGTKQYANFDAANVNFMKCRRLCNSDPICNGFIYNSATGQCRHVDSSSVVPFSDTKFSFYRKDCPLGKSLLVQT